MDLVQHGLFGAPEEAGGVVERYEPVGDVGDEACADLVVEADPPGRAGIACSQGSRPWSSQRRIVKMLTFSSSAACWMVTSCESGSGFGAAGIRARNWPPARAFR